MRTLHTLNSLFAIRRPRQVQKVDALHYFVTQTSSREKKKVLRIIVGEINKEQRATIEKARGMKK